MTRHLLLAVLVLSLPSLARAQGDASGAIAGYVYDPAGNPLKGISLTVRSPTQIGGPRKTTTNAEGFFRFAALFPGVFALDARADHMVPYVQRGIHVGLGTTELNIVMSVQTSSDTVIIIDTQPIIHPDSPKVT